MKLHNKLLACVALGAMLVSGSAVAALNADGIHLALTSLRLALVKMGVTNAMLSNSTPPSSNAEAHLGAPTKMRTPDISAIKVGKGGVISVYLTAATGAAHGVVQLVPMIVVDKQGRKGVEFTCFSPNIPDIATVAPKCHYQPATH